MKQNPITAAQKKVQSNAAILANELRKQHGFFQSNHPNNFYPLSFHDNHPRGKSPEPVAMTEDMYGGLESGEVGKSGLRVTFRAEEKSPWVEVKANYCSVCRCVFLDDVVYAIHKAAHSYKNPLECNLCGHESGTVHQWYGHFMHGNHRNVTSQGDKKIPDSDNNGSPWGRAWHQNGKK